MNSPRERVLELILWVGGSLLVGMGAYQVARYELFQRCPECFAQARSSSPALPVATPVPAAALPHIAGRLEVPRLGLSVVVLNGDDDDTLALGPGLMAGTPAPGEPGNSVISGHRDTAFRALRKIRIGDRVQFSGMRKAHYVVKKVFVVSPEDTSVLKSDTRSTLTMITCYPFRYIGNAPKRFIVQADLVKAD